MIHTDGKPTICTMGPIPGLDDDQTRAMHQVARDLAAVSNISVAEALRRIRGSVSPREAMLLEEAGDD